MFFRPLRPQPIAALRQRHRVLRRPFRFGAAFSVAPCPCGSEVPFGRSIPRISAKAVGCGKAVSFPFWQGGQTEWCWVARLCLRSRGQTSSSSSFPSEIPTTGTPIPNEKPTTIPFCRKSTALNRKRRKQRQSEALARKRRIAKRKPEPARAGRTGKRPSRKRRVNRQSAFSSWGALARSPSFVTSCPCESEVPFGRY